MPQENVEVAKAFYDACNARNSEALDRLLHPEAEITTLSARGGLGGDWSRGASHVEVASDFAAVLVVRDSRIVLVDSCSNRKDALEAVGRGSRPLGYPFVSATTSKGPSGSRDCPAERLGARVARSAASP
jgi:hypothetical protein